jgi:hypothetical protein
MHGDVLAILQQRKEAQSIQVTHPGTQGSKWQSGVGSPGLLDADTDL